MIWKRAHPVRGILAGVVVVAMGIAVGGFGIVAVEIFLLLVAGVIAFAVTSRGPALH